MAEDELDPNSNEIKWDAHNRVYPDGLQSTDGVEDTTFCVRLLWPTGRFAAPQPWDVEANRKEDSKASNKGKGKARANGDDSGKDGNGKDKSGDKPPFVAPKLRKEPQRLLICRARSKVGLGGGSCSLRSRTVEERSVGCRPEPPRAQADATLIADMTPTPDRHLDKLTPARTRPVGVGVELRERAICAIAR